MAYNLFVYGTIHPDRAPAEIAHVVRNLKLIGRGWIRAHLRHLDKYPALKLDSSFGSLVEGQIFRVPDQGILSELDKYEEFDPKNAEASLFRRKPVRVRLENGRTMSAWVYEYNRDLPESTADDVRRSPHRSSSRVRLSATKGAS